MAREYGSANLARKASSSAQDVSQAPLGSTPGSIDTNRLTSSPPPASFDVGGVAVDIDEAPPPWEVDPRYAKHDTDARRFLDCPDTWELRWLNRRQLDKIGTRDWTLVSANHPKVKVHNPAMISPEGYVSKGGMGGDVLAYMPKHWWESRVRLKYERAMRARQAGLDRPKQVAEEINRGSFGQGKGQLRATVSATPTHTQGEGRTMVD